MEAGGGEEVVDAENNEGTSDGQLKEEEEEIKGEGEVGGIGGKNGRVVLIWGWRGRKWVTYRRSLNTRCAAPQFVFLKKRKHKDI